MLNQAIGITYFSAHSADLISLDMLSQADVAFRGNELHRVIQKKKHIAGRMADPCVKSSGNASGSVRFHPFDNDAALIISP